MIVRLASMEQAAMFHECDDCGRLGPWARSVRGRAVCHRCLRAGARLTARLEPVRRARRIPPEAEPLRARPCSWCRAPGPSAIDHIEPVALGGSDDLDNLQPLCRSCNTAKGGRSMSEWASTADATRRFHRCV